jgi:hypothetical protein
MTRVQFYRKQAEQIGWQAKHWLLIATISAGTGLDDSIYELARAAAHFASQAEMHEHYELMQVRVVA